MKIYMLIVMFFLIGAFFIISEHNLALNKSGNFQKFSGLYSSWLGHIFENTGSVAGYVIKMDWLPKQNSSDG